MIVTVDDGPVVRAWTDDWQLIGALDVGTELLGDGVQVHDRRTPAVSTLPATESRYTPPDVEFPR